MNRGIIVRLLALVVTIVAGFGYILFGVLGWKLGAQNYPVTVMLSRAGGIYPQADVTLRGVVVGRVTSLKLSRNGVAVHLGIDPGVRIPADSTAAVRELSAAGEQYMDLVPTHPGGADLRRGGVIEEAHTSVPTSIDTTLVDLGQLLSSINTTNLDTLNQALSNGFGGAGGQLRTLLVQTQNLVGALRSSQGATVELQTGGQAVLNTFLLTNANFAQFSTQLNVLTKQLDTSNPDLQALLTNGQTSVTNLSNLLTADSGNLESLVTGLATVTDTAYERNPAIQAIFQVLPVVANDLASVSNGGQIHTELLYNAGDPICSYLPASSIASPTAATGAPSLDLGCSASAPDLLQRGAAHAPAPAGG
jgi:phospholipid/cholesterol/gamma-HCH transport system substrate-binding protein